MSPGQRRGKCGHVMANFDTHSHCTQCRDKGKGKEPCVSDPQTSNCQICNNLTSDQRQQLATPSYKLKKEKREAKLSEPTPSQDSDQLVDPSSVSVIGVVDEQGSVKSPTPVPPPDKKPKKDNKNSKKEKSPSTKVSKHSTDEKFAELDSKWSERFSRLEALIMANNFSSKVKVAPTHSPPHDVENMLSHSSDLLLQSLLELASLLKSISRPVKQWPINRLLQLSFLVRASLLTSISRPVKLELTDRLQLQGLLDRAPLLLCISRPVKPKLTDRQLQPTLQLNFSLQGKVMLTDLTLTGLLLPTGHCHLNWLTPAPLLFTDQAASVASSMLSDNPPLDLNTEEGELSEDQDQSVTDPDQPVSEEQNYRDTMQGIRSFMGWSHIPEMDSTASTSDDNPFAGPKTVTPGKVSVKMPTEDWLCRKLAKLNLTLVEGYPSHGSEAGGLAKDVFLRLARTQSKWYGLHTDPKAESSQISSWNIDASKLNSSYGRIAKYTGLSSTPPASRRISQETLRRWERSARETSVICNQAASFNLCLFKVQQNMKDQLKILKAENKG